MGSNLFSYIYFFTIIIVVTSDKCIQQSPCSCEYDDEKTINLKPLSEKPGFLQFAVGNLTYYFHPCADKKPDLPKELNVTDANATSIYIYDAGSKKVTYLGKAKEATFEKSKSYPGFYDIVYTHISSIITHITLICTADFHESVIYVIPNNQTDNEHNLLLFSSAACEHYEIHGLSTGSMLVILLMIFMTVYLLGGALVLHCLRGARGREMIPNIDFWTGLPLLVKDGVVFLQNGCKPTVPSNSDSYDRI